MCVKNLKILVADDSQVTREMIEAALRDKGYSVNGVADGQEALDRVDAANRSNESYDAVLLDYAMPGMDGLQTLKKIKEMYPKVKVIMVTAVETQEKIEEAMRLGADNYITKPLSLEYLEKDVQDKIEILAKGS